MVSYISIEVPEMYPYVLGVTGWVTFQCLLVGFASGAKRSTIFNKEVMHKNFGQEHHKYFKTSAPAGGYPDHGNGLYAQKLSYKDWFEFSLDQRAAKNFLEMTTLLAFSLLCVGLVFPQLAIGLGCAISILRVLYTMGYKKSPKDRIMLGGPLLMLSMLVLLLASLYSAFTMIQQLPSGGLIH